MSISFTLEQAQNLVEVFGGDPETIVEVLEGGSSSHSGRGLYAVVQGTEDDGSIFLGEEAPWE